MLIKFNRLNKACLHYKPPIPVTRFFDDVNTDGPVDEQIEQLLWIPALLTARFHAQFPALKSELDELFSIGMLTVCKVVNSGKHASDKIGGVVHVTCVRAFEDYANSLNAIVKVGATTRYKNHRQGRQTASHQRMARDHAVTDDHTDLIIRDAVEVLGFDLETLTIKQKRKLHETLS